MRDAGQIVVAVFAALGKAVRPGTTTGELNRVVEETIARAGAVPLFKGYRGFPASSCVSVNHEVVHGIPTRKRKLGQGDIVSVDVGVRYRGYCGDAAVTFPVGAVSAEAQQLLDGCHEALRRGVAAARPGNRLSQIGAAIQTYAERQGYGVVRRFVGHGIGTEMHEPPQVPNFVDEEVLKNDVILRPGMVLAIEPMLNAGTFEVRELEDGWTVVTVDGRLSAHFEHTVAIGPEGPDVLTPWDTPGAAGVPEPPEAVERPGADVDTRGFSGNIVGFAGGTRSRSHAERRAHTG